MSGRCKGGEGPGEACSSDGLESRLLLLAVGEELLKGVGLFGLDFGRSEGELIVARGRTLVSAELARRPDTILRTQLGGSIRDAESRGTGEKETVRFFFYRDTERKAN